MRLDAGCELVLDVAEPTPLILMLRPRSGYGQWVYQEEYSLEPWTPIIEYVDFYGNVCQRLVAPPGRFTVRAACGVMTADAIDTAPGVPYMLVQDLPDSVLHFLLPSRYCPADRLIDLAGQIVQNVQPGYDQAEAIRAWINQNVEYRYGTSDTTTTALETAQNKVGVCRDFTHLGIALCRALSIPARMVVGYLHNLEPIDLHAWFEAFVGGRWYTFDATQTSPRGGRIVIAYGTDATDVALSTQFGPASLTEMKVWVNESTEVHAPK